MPEVYNFTELTSRNGVQKKPMFIFSTIAAKVADRPLVFHK